MGKRKLDDINLRNRLFDQVRAGHGKHRSCEIVGISPETFREYWKLSAEFREQYDEALSASTEPVVAMMREMAIEGDMTAAKEYMKHAGPPPRSEIDRQRQEIEVTVKHELDPAQVNSIRELEALVQNRTAALPPAQDYEDAEIIEDDEGDPS